VPQPTNTREPATSGVIVKHSPSKMPPAGLRGVGSERPPGDSYTPWANVAPTAHEIVQPLSAMHERSAEMLAPVRGIPILCPLHGHSRSSAGAAESPCPQEQW